MANNMNSILESLNSNRIDSKRVNESDDRYQNFIKACQSNATYKKAQAIAKKYGYSLSPLCYVETFGSKKHVNIGFENQREGYKPEIYYGSSFGKPQEFEIQTTSYGSLSIAEHDKFIEAVTNANKMVKELSKLDLTTLYLDTSGE